jgi:AraC-like DNA-binding protein
LHSVLIDSANERETRRNDRIHWSSTWTGPRIHNPAFAVFRTIVLEEAAALGTLDVEGALVLVTSGTEALARFLGCSSRTIRRRLRSADCRPKEFVERVRRRMTVAGLTVPVATSVVAAWLGFSSTSSYRRWVRSTFPGSLRDLRRCVRRGAEFPGCSGAVRATAQTKWQPGVEGVS